MDFQAILTKMAETLAPGGTAETTRVDQINKEAGMLANRMEGANISRGLGNATMGVGATVGAQAAGARESARSNILGQYIQTLQFLMDASQRQQGLDIDATRAAGPTNAQRGLDAFGAPMRGTLAATEQALSEAQLRQVTQPEKVAPSASQFPSLYSAGGMSGGLDFGDDPFADLSQPAPYDYTSPIRGYGQLVSGETAGTPMVYSNRV
jgi:hypothetical protein